MAHEEEILMDSRDVAEMLGVTPGRVRHLIAAGDLHPRRVGWVWVFTKSDVERYMERRPPRGRPRKESKTG